MSFCRRWVPFFSYQTTFGVIFAQIFRYLAKVLTDFVQISTNFARIFTKSKKKAFGGAPAPQLLQRPKWDPCFNSVRIIWDPGQTQTRKRTHVSWRALSFIASWISGVAAFPSDVGSHSAFSAGPDNRLYFILRGWMWLYASKLTFYDE